MKPTVTIDLEEYQGLVKINDAYHQNKSAMYYYTDSGYGTCILTGKEVEERLLKELEISQESNKRLKEQIAEHVKREVTAYYNNKPTKKWYEFWK
jgi:hypothetical protein